jgi:hypothetical protein
MIGDVFFLIRDELDQIAVRFQPSLTEPPNSRLPMMKVPFTSLVVIGVLAFVAPARADTLCKAG